MFPNGPSAKNVKPGFNNVVSNVCSSINRINEQTGRAVGTMNDVQLKMQDELGYKSMPSSSTDSREYLLKYEPKSTDDLPTRSMQDSFTTAILPLSTDKILQNTCVTSLGNVQLGFLLANADLFASWTVIQHIKLPNLDSNLPLPYFIVTILVDKISFTNLIPKNDSDIRFSGHVSWVGQSSIEVVIWSEQQIDGKWQEILRGLFLMVSRNATNTKSLIVNPLVPATDEETTIYGAGETHRNRRIQMQKESLFYQGPNSFEQKLIHNLFVKTIDMKNQKFNQRILPNGAIWMEDCVLSNTIFSQPVDANGSKAVFGGYLMRYALDLSCALAYRFSKHQPKLEHVSDIKFQRIVPISSFTQMHAHVIFTEMNYIEIVVITEVFDVPTGQHNTTNVFYYTYSNKQKVPEVIPKTYDETMWYLDGRRRFNFAMDLDGNRTDQIAFKETVHSSLAHKL